MTNKKKTDEHEDGVSLKGVDDSGQTPYDEAAPKGDREPSPTVPKKTSTSSEFDPANLRLSQDFASDLGLKKHFLSLQVRKPNRREWVRSHADPAFQLDTMLMELKDENEMYLVSPEVCHTLFDEVAPFRLTLALNRDKIPFLWKARLPKIDGKSDGWLTTSLCALELAQTKWVRVASNMAAKHYDVYESSADLSEPEWPQQPFAELLELAFKGHFIRDLEHPIVRRLKGLE